MTLENDELQIDKVEKIAESLFTLTKMVQMISDEQQRKQLVNQTDIMRYILYERSIVYEETSTPQKIKLTGVLNVYEDIVSKTIHENKSRADEYAEGVGCPRIACIDLEALNITITAGEGL